ncbi:MAG: hypothetical protein D6784_08885 [Chloroflexi bacterium]|nr:MAG: hypothetical protein D6784_08885 [Chloroflexota bacterium]
MLSPEQKYGLRGEIWVARKLEQLGYDVKMLRDFNADYDLLVDGLVKVEVKTARKKLYRKRGDKFRYRWQFKTANFYPREEMAIVFLCETFTGFFPFVTFGSLVKGRLTVQVTSAPVYYRGWLAPWRDAWWVIDRVKQYALKSSPQLEFAWI